MSDSKAATLCELRNGFEHVNTAPILHFDNVSCFGALNDVVQIELTANALLPLANGGIDVRMIEAARLRCSRAAAAALRYALDKALETPSHSPESDHIVSAASH